MAPKTKVAEQADQAVCGACGKSIGVARKGSLTSWIFRADRCACPAGAQIRLVVNEDDNAVAEPSAPDVHISPRYEVQELVGQGGMGSVYRVLDKELNKILAVKTLRPEWANDREAVKRFRAEVEAVCSLTHENLVSVYDQGTSDDGTPYLVMDYLQGESLAQLLGREFVLEPTRAIGIFSQICEAVEHAHAHNIIHRDLKPSNVILTHTEAQLDVVKVVDFGIAKLLPTVTRETLNLTQQGELFGSPSYMSPEQCTADSLDMRSDVYSMGCLMYEAMTGAPPFQADNPVKTIMMQMTETPPPIGVIAGANRVPQDLENVIMRCLEKSPEKRFQTMGDLKKALSSVKLLNSRKKSQLNASVAFFHRRRQMMFLAYSFIALSIFICGFGVEVLHIGAEYLRPMPALYPFVFVGMWIALCSARQMAWCTAVNRMIAEAPAQPTEVRLFKRFLKSTILVPSERGQMKERSIYFRGGKFPPELSAMFDGNLHKVKLYRDANGVPVAAVIGKYLCLISKGPLTFPEGGRCE